jgi:hypothetical protein
MQWSMGRGTDMPLKDILGLPQYRVLDVKARRYGSDFRWEIRESDGRIIESSSDAYSTDREAVRAGNRAARAIRKQCANLQTVVFGVGR